MIIKTCLKHGDLTESQVRRSVENGKERIRCRECRIEADAKWRLDNPEKHRESASRSRNKNRSKARDWAREDRAKYPEKYREYARRNRDKYGSERMTREIIRNHGLTKNIYDSMFELQENKCAICNMVETKRGRTPGTICRLAVDHCHSTGKIRQLLCHSCNTGIGKFKDDISLLEKAIEYLRKHETTSRSNADGGTAENSSGKQLRAL